MAVLDQVAPYSHGFFHRIGAALKSVGLSMMEVRMRRDQFEYYNNMSDAQLEAKGLRREDIARHVYRDLCCF